MSNENKKLTLAVIFGGVSSEHDISCISAKGIISNIDYNKYNVILLGITKDGRWYIFNDDISLLPNDRWTESKSLIPAYISPDTSVGGIVTAKGEIIKLDCVFPVLHGKNGEDGTIQGLLQLAQIPYVGCDATSSGVCMDKAVANAVADAFDIRQNGALSPSILLIKIGNNVLNMQLISLAFLFLLSLQMPALLSELQRRIM